MKNKHFELINELSDRELLFHLYATQALLLTISLILGFFLFDDFSQFIDIFQWNDVNVLYLGVGAGLIIVIFDLIMMKALPDSFYFDGGLNKKIFQNRNFFHIGVIAALVAISEEILFRGVIQTHFGLVISSVIFALVHYRYLFNWFLFVNIIVLSFLIGFIYEATGNLAVTIAMHFTIDFLLGVSIRIFHQKKV